MKKKPLKIGLTGGIGSGKTTIAKVFEVLKIPIYNADNRAKFLMNSDSEIIAKLKTLFGKEVYDENGLLNRKYLAKIVFNNKEKLEKLNSIVHPKTYQDFDIWYKKKSTPYVIKEAAILFETGGYQDMDKVILVTAPEKVRIERVIKRDNVDSEDVKIRMDKQWKDEKKIPLSDFIIYNNDELVIPQVLKVHDLLLNS